MAGDGNDSALLAEPVRPTLQTDISPMPLDMMIILFALASIAGLVVMLLRQRTGGHDSETLAELKGQLAQLAAQSGELQKIVAAQMQDTEGRLGTRLENSLRDQNDRTNRSLTGMAEKLAVIEQANAHISALSGQVGELQNILSNKQARGSFGEVQLENLIRDALPESAFNFQHTLGNGRRVDCFLDMPAPPGPICIDSKFPLESYRTLTTANGEAERTAARRMMETDVKKHINDIAERYIIPGETADSAIMFLPSESVYAEINLQLPKLVEESRRRRVYMAGPDNLMLILHTVRAILRDARMHEAAGVIKAEVETMLQDVSRLDERIKKLATHFGQVEKDIDDIQISSRKISSRGAKITQIDVSDGGAPSPELPPETTGHGGH
jgi:DNA recombination protein RmuC